MYDNIVKNHAGRLLATGGELAAEATAAQVMGVFRSVGIRAILLKGASLARWLYDAGDARLSIDVDLLIAPADRAGAEAALGALGYRPFPRNVDEEGNRHASAWDRDVNGIGVDLHVNLAGIGVSAEDAWSALSQGTEELLVAGTAVEVLGPAARATHVALHAAQHGARWEWGVEDLTRALDRLPFEVWQAAAALAVSLDAAPAFVAGLRLVSKGEQLSAALGLPVSTTVEVALRATTPPDLSLGLHRLVTTAGFAGKAAFAAGKLFPRADWMRASLPLARRGTLGLAAAYAWRPVWFLIRAPAAVRAFRAARKQSERSA